MKVRCPHCHNPIEVVDEESLNDIECPSCGSSFDLLKDSSTVSYQPAKQESISHFELSEKLGTGAFGTVWKARDTQLDRTVALKIPRKSQLDETETEKFIREARAAAQLQHPNIVTVHEVGRDGSTVYIVADLVDGLTLSDWLTGQTLTPKEAAEICKTIAEAVHHAHECRVIHRDLKPSNIMLDQEGVPHVMDFGLAKREAGEITVTVEGQILGTPAYMSPEQARGESHHVDRRSDIYSIGVILFELITNERPFRGNARMLLHQVVHDEAPSPRQMNSTIPKDLETICLRCLEKDPQKRFQTAHDLAEELQRFLGGHAIVSRPIGNLGRVFRWTQRNPLLATLTLLLSSLLLGLAIGGPILAVHESGLRRVAVDAKTEADQSILRERETAEQLRGNLYLADMNRIADYWEAGDTALVEQVLERWHPQGNETDFRGFEWQLWLEKLHEWESQSLPGKNASSATVCYSPDGKTIVTASGDVLLWDASTRQARQRIKGAEVHGFKALAISPDAATLATGNRADTGLVQFWDIRTGDQLGAFTPGFKWIESLTFSSDGSQLACGGFYGGIEIWDFRDQTLRHKFDTKESIYDLIFDGEDKRLLSLSPRVGVRVWDLETGLARLLNDSHGRSFAISPDHTRVAIGRPLGSVYLIDLATGTRIHNWPTHGSTVCSVAFSPDGQYLVSGSTGQRVSMTIREISSGRSAKFNGHKSGIHGLSFSRDGKMIASVSVDNTLRLWTFSNETLKNNLTVPPGHEIWFGPDNEHLIYNNFNSIYRVTFLAENNPSEHLFDLAPNLGAYTVSDDGSLMACGFKKQSNVEIWDLLKNEQVAELEGSSPDALVMEMAFSPDGQLLAVGGYDSTVRIWNIATKETIANYQHDYLVFRVTYSPNGKRLLSVADGLYLWETETGRRISKKLTTTIHSIDFLPSGEEFITAGSDGNVVLWDASTLTPRKTFRGHGGVVQKFAISPDGKLLAVPTHYERIKIWDIEQGLPRTELPGYARPVRDIKFSQDGNWLMITAGIHEEMVKWHIPKRVSSD